MNIVAFLIGHDLLLVHFAPPRGIETDEAVIAGKLGDVLRNKPYLCCSTISSDEPNGSWGKVGLIISPHTVQAVKCVAPHDMGSEQQPDGTITCRPEFRTVNETTLLQSIENRADMNEWVVSDYRVVGVFVTAMTAQCRDDIPLLTSIPNWAGDLPIYTTYPGAFTKFEGPLSINEVSVMSIYGA